VSFKDFIFPVYRIAHRHLKLLPGASAKFGSYLAPGLSFFICATATHEILTGQSPDRLSFFICATATHD